MPNQLDLNEDNSIYENITLVFIQIQQRKYHVMKSVAEHGSVQNGLSLNHIQ